MKKQIGLIGVIIIIVIIGKYVLSIPYQLTEKQEKMIQEINKGLLIKDFYTLLQEDSDPAISYQDIRLKQFDNFNCSEKDNQYICTKENTSITIEKTKSYLDLAKEEKLEVKGLRNDIDLFGKIKDSSNSNLLFRSLSNQKKDKQFQLFAIKHLPVIHSLDLISGDIEGYITHPSSEERIIYLTQKEKTYKITLKDLSFFKKSTIQELLNTIKIKD
ncbi:MAG: hypothetical protein IJ193_01795 [Bacilli bacterium]|nr:hypothetical protein [Bacilli bacterium]